MHAYLIVFEDLISLPTYGQSRSEIIMNKMERFAHYAEELKTWIVNNGLMQDIARIDEPTSLGTITIVCSENTASLLETCSLVKNIFKD